MAVGYYTAQLSRNSRGASLWRYHWPPPVTGSARRLPLVNWREALANLDHCRFRGHRHLKAFVRIPSMDAAALAWRAGSPLYDLGPSKFSLSLHLPGLASAKSLPRTTMDSPLEYPPGNKEESWISISVRVVVSFAGTPRISPPSSPLRSPHRPCAAGKLVRRPWDHWVPQRQQRHRDAYQGVGGSGEGRLFDRLHHHPVQQAPADGAAEAQGQAGHDILALTTGCLRAMRALTAG